MNLYFNEILYLFTKQFDRSFSNSQYLQDDKALFKIHLIFSLNEQCLVIDKSLVYSLMQLLPEKNHPSKLAGKKHIIFKTTHSLVC